MPDRKTKAAFIEPMLLLRTEKLPEGNEWLYELKLDGYIGAVPFMIETVVGHAVRSFDGQKTGVIGKTFDYIQCYRFPFHY